MAVAAPSPQRCRGRPECVLQQHDNVFLVLSGIDGRNPDDMLQIDVNNSEMTVDIYPPLLDDFGATAYDNQGRYDGTEYDTRLPIPTDEVIGEATAASGWPATFTWSGLTESETYAWYVVSRDSDTGDDLPAGEVHQMRVFIATADGTDDAARELTVPENVTITAGDALAPMNGVSATEVDGNLADSVQVIGSLDTATPGVYVLIYVVEDGNGNQATVTRAITVTYASGADQTGGQLNRAR